MSLRTLVDNGGLAGLERPEAVESHQATSLSGRSLWSAFRERYTRSRAQHELQRLSDHLLDDVGLNRELVEPASNSCWDRP